MAINRSTPQIVIGAHLSKENPTILYEMAPQESCRTSMPHTETVQKRQVETFRNF
jgi:hypothetical protein